MKNRAVVILIQKRRDVYRECPSRRPLNIREKVHSGGRFCESSGVGAHLQEKARLAAIPDKEGL